MAIFRLSFTCTCPTKSFSRSGLMVRSSLSSARGAGEIILSSMTLPLLQVCECCLDKTLYGRRAGRRSRGAHRIPGFLLGKPERDQCADRVVDRQAVFSRLAGNDRLSRFFHLVP